MYVCMYACNYVCMYVRNCTLRTCMLSGCLLSSCNLGSGYHVDLFVLLELSCFRFLVCVRLLWGPCRVCECPQFICDVSSFMYFIWVVVKIMVPNWVP